MNDAALAALAAAVFAVDPAGIGGVRLRAPSGEPRLGWLHEVEGLMGADATWRRAPQGVGDERLLGGLDLAATLAGGRPLARRGLLAEAHGGVLVMSMAERMEAGTAARVCAALDDGVVRLARDGFESVEAARFGVLALDEGIDEDERPPPALLERLAIHLDFSALAPGTLWPLDVDAADVARARARLARVQVGREAVETLCGAAEAFGVGSVRAPLLALRVARACAALAGEARVGEDAITDAVRLVLVPRATRLPAPHEADASVNEQPPPPESDGGADAEPGKEPAGALEERVLEAAKAAIPASLLERLAQPGGRSAQSRSGGRSGAIVRSNQRGRPSGVRAGRPGTGARLNVVETLRAAAPWQRLRRQQAGPERRVHVRVGDFRVTRYKRHAETVSVFAVDASGSAALHRLAETKGAVELLLADCYVRRDRVALVSFRGADAELLLPPTRSLVRAKRALAGLPGGGGTPLAAGIEMATAVAEAARKRGETATVVLLTDGRANVGLDGKGGRERAAAEALAAARALCALGIRGLLLDTSPRSASAARDLAAAMGALYLPLPFADATSISEAVRVAGAAA